MVSTRSSLHDQKYVLEKLNWDPKRCMFQCQQSNWGLQQNLEACQQSGGELQDLVTALIELAPHPVIVVSLKTNQILFRNHLLNLLWQLEDSSEESDLLAETFIDKADLARIMEPLQNGGVITNYSLQIKQLGGEVVDVVVSSKTVDYQGSLAALLILQLSLGAERAEKSTEKLQSANALFAAAHYFEDAIEITDAQAKIQYTNPAFESITGYTTDEVVGKTPAALLRSGCHDEAFYQTIWQTISSGQVWNGDLIGRHKNGSLLHQKAVILPILDESGNIAQFVAVKRNVTQCKQIEDEWQKFAALVEHSNDFIAMSSLDGKVLYVNLAGRALVGLDSLEEAQAKAIADYLPDDEWVRFCKVTMPALETRGYDSGEGQLRHFKTNELIHVHRSCFAVKHTETGETICWATIQRDITAQKQAETALRESEERFRAIAEALPEAMIISRITDGRVLYANAQVESTFGLPAAQLVGRTSLEFYAHAVDRVKLLEQLKRDGFLQNYEVQAKKADGTLFWIAASLRYLTFQGEVALVSIFHDITQRKQTEMRLEAIACQQAAVAELGQQALAGTELTTLMNRAVALVNQTLEVECSGIFKQLPGGNMLMLEAGLGWQSNLIGSALVGTQANSQIGYALLTQQPVIVEDLQINTQFSGPPLLHNHRVVSGISVVIPGQGHPFGVLGAYATHQQTFTQDAVHFLQAIANVLATAIERKQAEERLHLMERAIASSNNGIVLTDANQPDNPIIYVNPAFERISGYTAEEVMGRNCRFLQGASHDQLNLEELRTALQEHRECHVTLRNHRKDGTLFWNELYVAPVFDAEGYITHFIGIQTDITERKQAEAALQEQEERYRRIVETATEGIWVLDKENNTSFVNQQMAMMLGYSEDEMLGKTLFSFMDEEGIAIATAKLEGRRQGVHETHDFRFLRKDGTDVWAIVSTAPFFDQDGHYAGALGMLSDITDRKRAEAALLESEQRLDGILRSLEDVVWSVSAITREVLFLNPAAEKVYGRSVTEFFENPDLWLEVIHPDDQERVRAQAQAIWQAGSQHREYRIVRPDGEIRWLSDRCRTTYDANGKAIRLDGISTDVTERRQAEEALRKSEEQFRLIFELAPVGIALNSLDGRFLEVNQAFCQALGYSSNELLNQTFTEISHIDDLAADLSLNNKLIQGELAHFQLEKRYLAKDGRIVNGILNATLVRDAEGRPLHTIAQVVDITDRKRMENQLIHDAFFDSLTGLHNRVLFMDRLQQAIARSNRDSEEEFAVLFLDLDRFKLVNDSLGHLVGDQLLVAIAQRLQACLRTCDTIARLGGDEFAILLDPIHTLNDVTWVAERIQQALSLPLNLDSCEIFTTASIGIALSNSGYERPEDLLRNADTAMYRAKEQGKACYVLFDTAMYDQTVTRLQLETDLRWAIERQELRVHYQPIVALDTKQVAGFEALVRWQHPERGLISPAEFIPVAEETGLIIPIGEWVLQTACQQLRQWQTRFPTLSLTISVNLSSKQLSQPNLVQRTAQILKQSGLAPEHLKLEITESGIMHNAASAAKLLAQLKALNIQLSIDDFGTGYSSLSRLHQFPIDTLKIDRSFVKLINQIGENAEMVQAIIALAHSLGMDVIAEGVETAEQLEQLKQLQCEFGQGYFFSQPLNPQAVEVILAMDLVYQE